MSKLLQKFLLLVGIIAVVALVVEIGLAVAATQHGSTPKKVVHVIAGPYALTVSLYDDPANAGFALPFAIAPSQHTSLSYNVSSIPGQGLHATPIHASLSSDPQVVGGVQGAAEITVQGSWQLHITVNGSAGQGIVDVPITATAPPAIPDWLGWSIGLIPFAGLLVFLLLQRDRKRQQEETRAEQEIPAEIGTL